MRCARRLDVHDEDKLFSFYFQQSWFILKFVRSKVGSKQTPDNYQAWCVWALTT
jgi:hypothetical protein